MSPHRPHITLRHLAAAAVAVGYACSPGGPTATVGDAGASDSRGDTSVPAPLCGAAFGAEVELLAFARLSASVTRAPVIPPWPREDRDSIAAIRDDAPDTGWKVPVGEAATVTLDLGPRVGRPVALDRIALVFTAPGPERVTVRLLKACGDAAGDALVVAAGETTLELAGACAACVEVEVRADADITLTALSLVSRDAAIDAATPRPEPATTTDHGAGVVEGFYGVPWTFGERRRMLQTLAHLGLGTYIYAPKSDPLHRARWREPYPPDFTAALGELADYGEQLGVDVVFGISPFIDLVVGAPGDLIALESKLLALQAAGIRHFAVLADDIELDATLEVDAALGQAHVDVTLEALAALRAVDPAATMRFVPTVYSDQRRLAFPDGAGYLKALTALPDDLPWLWTGPDTGNAVLVPEDLTIATALVGRPPTIWDNHWANDGGDGFFGHISLRPYGGRDPGLRAATSGIVENPLMQGGLARLAVGTFGAALAGAKDAELIARAVAVEALRSPESAGSDSQIAALVMACFDAPHGDDPGHRGFEAAMTALASAMDPATPAQPVALATALGDALPILAPLAALGSTVHHSGLAVDLVDELAFPLEKVRAEADRAIASLALLAARTAGVPLAQAHAALSDAEERSLTNRFIFSTGATDALAAQAIAGVEPTRLSAVSALDSPDGACFVGEPFRFVPTSAPTAQLAAAGPPDLTVDGRELRFLPRHPGAFAVVALAWTADPPAFTAARYTIVCEAR